MCYGMNCRYEQVGGENWGACNKPSMQGKPGSSCFEEEDEEIDDNGLDDIDPGYDGILGEG